jgi:hypothetical protein
VVRSCYKIIIHLHPPAFRRQFGAEMLSVFEDASEAAGSAFLLTDGAISLLRQWMKYPELWKVLAACVGAAMELLPGGLGLLASVQADIAPRIAVETFAHTWTGGFTNKGVLSTMRVRLSEQAGNWTGAVEIRNADGRWIRQPLSNISIDRLNLRFSITDRGSAALFRGRISDGNQRRRVRGSFARVSGGQGAWAMRRDDFRE